MTANPPTKSSTQKGGEFEDVVFELLKSELENGRFLGAPDRYKIFQKKGYFSPIRNAEIIFDIAIEIYLPGQETYSLLCIIECKNLSRPVDIDDAGEFYDNLSQIGLAGIKGIIACSSSFRQGTIDYSANRKIELLRVEDDQKLKWVLTRPAHHVASYNFGAESSTDALRSITDQDFLSDVFLIACNYEGLYTNSVSLFLFSILRDTEQESLDVDDAIIVPPPEESLEVNFLSKEKIESKSTSLLNEVDYKGSQVVLSDILDHLGQHDRLEFVESTEDLTTPRGSSILGSISFDPNQLTVYGDADLNSPRTRFTIAHELGHLMLEHGRYLAKEYVAESDFISSGKQSLGIQGLERLEWQANTFAAYLLMPTEPLLKSFFELIGQYNLRNRGHGWLFVDSQRDNLKNYFNVTDRLMDTFQVSRQALSIRLDRLGILNDSRSQPTQMASSLSRMQGDLF